MDTDAGLLEAEDSLKDRGVAGHDKHTDVPRAHGGIGQVPAWPQPPTFDGRQSEAGLVLAGTNGRPHTGAR